MRENKQNKTGLVVFVCGGGWMGKEMKRNEVSSLITYCMIQLYVSPIISNLYSSMGHGITFVIKNICFNIVSLSPILVIFQKSDIIVCAYLVNCMQYYAIFCNVTNHPCVSLAQSAPLNSPYDYCYFMHGMFSLTPSVQGNCFLTFFFLFVAIAK